jgi:peptidoglycan biosynthesis protein MviN/MurJ (putative lipid II flippase)
MMLKFNAAAALLNVAGNIIFLYYFRNIIVAGWTTLASYACVFMMLQSYVARAWSIDWQPGFLTKISLASLVMTACVTAILKFFSSSGLGLFLSLILGVGIYILLLYLLKAYDKSEVDALKRFLRRT